MSNNNSNLTLKQMDSAFPPMRWMVTSQSRKNVAHSVDLYAGSCTCEEYVFRLNGKDSQVPPALRKCKHIRAVREKVADIIIEYNVKIRA
jgi:hypothetical protein